MIDQVRGFIGGFIHISRNRSQCGFSAFFGHLLGDALDAGFKQTGGIAVFRSLLIP